MRAWMTTEWRIFYGDWAAAHWLIASAWLALFIVGALASIVVWS